MKNNFLRLVVSFVLLLSFSISCQNSDVSSKDPRAHEQRSTPEKFNSPDQMNKPIIVMISIDGFRHDYLDKYKPPTLLAWAKTGVRADGIIPSFPTLTFPNHISLITGLRPGHHGIVGNKFYDEQRKEYYSMSSASASYDGSWYRGLPLWAAAENEGMLAATCFWVGSEAKIAGVNPTYLKPYDGSVSNEQRVTWVTEWLSLPDDKRPHFIGLYFSDVDHAGHLYGPDSNEVARAVLDIDTELGKLKKYIAAHNLEVQIVVVSDHGMKNIESTVDLSSVSNLKKLKSSGKGAAVMFYSDNQNEIDKAYNEIKKIPGNFSVYKAADYPTRWQLEDTNRRGELLVVGDPGVYIGFQEGFAAAGIGSSNKATHGWDTAITTDLNGLFIANGTMFKKGLRIKAFDNIHVYPLVEDILAIKNRQPVDGKLEVLKSILL